MSLLLTREQVAAELAVSIKTVDRLIIKGCFKVVRIGTRAIRIPYSEVVKFARKDQPTLELN
jgi:excisionase family DNA binding protein